MRRRDWINSMLPDELIIEVFYKLDSKSRDACSLVCRRWKTLEGLSRDTIRIGGSGCPDSLINVIASRFVNVTNLYIDERLSDAHRFGVEKRRTAQRPARLRQFSVKMGLQSKCLSDAGLSTVADGLTKLEKLTLIWCYNATNEGLKFVAQKCLSLKSLDLQGCNVGDQGICAIGECCKKLETVNFRLCEALTDTGLIKLAVGCGSTLKSLSVDSCDKLTNASLEAVGSHCKHLESLSLDSEYIHDKGVIAVAEGCNCIKNLSLKCMLVTDKALTAVGNLCLLLESLALYSLQKLSDKSVCTIGKNCKKLKSLMLNDCSLIGDDAIISIAIGCKNLKKLHIQSCVMVGSKGIIAVGENCKYLTDLNISRCDRVRDEALVAIGHGCPLLRHLNVDSCHRISNTGITAIARGCPQLTYLDVSFLQNLGDMALAEIGEGCPLLQDIVLSHCREITDVGLTHLVNGCKFLESCLMVFCKGVTAAGVDTVVSTCTNIKKIIIEKSKVSERTRRRAGSIISYPRLNIFGIRGQE